MSMFWGVKLEHGKRYSQKVEAPYHLTMAALEVHSGLKKKGPLSVIMEREKKEFVLCTLDYDRLYQQSLDLVLDESEDVTYFVKGGEGIVHLTGYLMPPEDDFDEDMFDDEASEASEEAPIALNAGKQGKVLESVQAKRKCDAPANLKLNAKKPKVAGDMVEILAKANNKKQINEIKKKVELKKVEVEDSEEDDDDEEDDDSDNFEDLIGANLDDDDDDDDEEEDEESSGESGDEDLKSFQNKLKQKMNDNNKGKLNAGKVQIPPQQKTPQSSKKPFNKASPGGQQKGPQFKGQGGNQNKGHGGHQQNKTSPGEFKGKKNFTPPQKKQNGGPMHAGGGNKGSNNKFKKNNTPKSWNSAKK